MAKRKKASKSQLEYRKQRSRIQRLIRSYENQGLIVNYEPPKIPKRITESSVRRLEKITPKVIRTKTVGIDFDTGEILSFNQFKQKQREEKKVEPFEPELPREEELIIQNFRLEMSYYNDAAKELIYNWLDNLIRREGKRKVAQMLSDAYDQGKIPNYEVMYNSELLHGALSEMLDLMQAGNETRSALEDEFEKMESWG